MRRGSFQIIMPSNAIDVVQPHLARKQSANEKMFPDTIDFGSTHSSGKITTSPSSVASTSSMSVSTIDNTNLVYVPIRLPCGVETFCSPEVLSRCPMVLRSLQTDLVQLVKLLPWSVQSLVLRTKIWINASYSYGSRDDPRVLRHSTAHHHEGWLLQW